MLSLNIGGQLLDLSHPLIMGIINVTPDSFYDGGKNNTVSGALSIAGQYLSEGAAMLDLGAYSSRPGADDISEQEELDRLLPVLRAIRKEFPAAVISIDTFRAEVARAAAGEGAHIINDISGGELDPNMFNTAAELQLPYILMHMRGTPQTMALQTDYRNISTEVCAFFAEKTSQLKALGIKDIILDPGFGFAKNLDQNYELLQKLPTLCLLGYPVLVGLSRKSMIYKLLDCSADEALNGTSIANTIALMNGANILRVHDVKAAAEAIKIVRKVKDPNEEL